MFRLETVAIFIERRSLRKIHRPIQVVKLNRKDFKHISITPEIQSSIKNQIKIVTQ